MALHGDSDRISSGTEGTPVGALTDVIARLARAPLPKTPPALVPGARVGRYEIIRAIGRGGFGSVHEAHDAALNRLVAVKVIFVTDPADPVAAREGEAAARLTHPNIAAVHDAGVLEDGTPYLVYERLHGETLENRLDRGPIPPAEAVAIASRVALALEHAHQAGVVHRDLKPANVFLTADGEVKVLDFGVALLFGRPAPSGGTPAYMAPEQRRGEPEDRRTDLYALGVLILEMAGVRDDTTAQRHKSIPAPIRHVVVSLLADDPAERPRTARAALVELERAARLLTHPRARRGRVLAAAALVVLAIASGAAVLVRERWVHPPATDPRTPSIAVLPFQDLSPGHDQEYFSAGIAEEISSALARLDGLRVSGRTSASALRDGREDLRAVGRKLGVAAVLDGSVRMGASRVRITAQLVDVEDGYRRWSESFDRELTDIFAVQEEIATAIAGALQVKLLGSRRPTTQDRRTSSLEAYRQYLLGRQLYDRGSTEDYRRSRDAFESALRLDPGYAPAHAWLSMVLRGLSVRTEKSQVPALRRRAIDEAERAVALGPDLTDAYSARGLLRVFWQHDWKGAEDDLSRAVAISPGDAVSRRRLAIVLAARGRLAEAIRSAEYAAELDPLDATTWHWVGTLRFGAGRLAEAREAWRRALEASPQNEDVHSSIAYSYVVERKLDAALAEAQLGQSGDVLAVTAIVEHDRGHPAEAQRALDVFIARYGDPVSVATVLAWQGDRDGAFEWLHRAAAQDGEVAGLSYDPLMAPLHGDTRWTALLSELGLPVRPTD